MLLSRCTQNLVLINGDIMYCSSILIVIGIIDVLLVGRLIGDGFML